MLPLNQAVILASPGNGSKTTMVGDNDYLHFYDHGGYSGSYDNIQGDYVHTFTSENNEHLSIVFSTPNHYLQTGDTIYLYDGTEPD